MLEGGNVSGFVCKKAIMSDNWNNHVLYSTSTNLGNNSHLWDNCFAFCNRKTLIFEQGKREEGSKSDCRWFADISSKHTHYKALVLVLIVVAVMWNSLIKFALKLTTFVIFFALCPYFAWPPGMQRYLPSHAGKAALTHEDNASNLQVQTKRFVLWPSRRCFPVGNPAGQPAFPRWDGHSPLNCTYWCERNGTVEKRLMFKRWDSPRRGLDTGQERWGLSCDFLSGQLDISLSRESLLNQKG